MRQSRAAQTGRGYSHHHREPYAHTVKELKQVYSPCSLTVRVLRPAKENENSPRGAAPHWPGVNSVQDEHCEE